MKTILSRSNPGYKALRQELKDRQSEHLWLEGRHLCQEFLSRVGRPELVLFDQKALAAGDAELLTLLERLRHQDSNQTDTECWELPTDLLASLSTIAGAQGVAFVATRPTPALPKRLDGDCVILDRLQDPGNVGSIIRSCAAAGIPTLITLAGGASAWSAKALRAGQGAHFSLRIYDQVDPVSLANCLATPLAATALEGGRDLYDGTWTGPTAWMLGHEGQGVSDFWLQRAERRVFIPQAEGVESLNVAAAAAVCLFEQRRQRRS